MRHVTVVVLAALAFPTHADQVCEQYKDVIKKICIKSFSNALGRDLGSFEGKRQEEQNNYVAITCGGVESMVGDNCSAGNLDRPAGRTPCEHITKIAHGLVEAACTINSTPDQSRTFDQVFTMLGKNQRGAICKKAVAQVRPVAQKSCP